MPQVPEDAHGEAVAPLRFFLKSKKARCIAAPQVVKIPLWGGLEGHSPPK